MNLEPIIQSEISQKDRDKYCIFTHAYGIQKDGTYLQGSNDTAFKDWNQNKSEEKKGVSEK